MPAAIKLNASTMNVGLALWKLRINPNAAVSTATAVCQRRSLRKSEWREYRTSATIATVLGMSMKSPTLSLGTPASAFKSCGAQNTNPQIPTVEKNSMAASHQTVELKKPSRSAK